MSLGPDGMIEVFEDLVKFVVEDLVEAFVAATFALEDEMVFVECGAIDNAVGLGLGGEFFQPLALRGGPIARG